MPADFEALEYKNQKASVNEGVDKHLLGHYISFVELTAHRIRNYEAVLNSGHPRMKSKPYDKQILRCYIFGLVCIICAEGNLL